MKCPSLHVIQSSNVPEEHVSHSYSHYTHVTSSPVILSNHPGLHIQLPGFPFGTASASTHDSQSVGLGP